MQSDSKEFASGSFAGTPAYAAPEQLWGAEIGPAADWYGVGVILYESIAGRVPYPRGTFGASRTNATPPRVSHATVPEPIAKLIERLLAPDPAARPSLDELLGVLTASRTPPTPAAETMPSGVEPTFVNRVVELRLLQDGQEFVFDASSTKNVKSPRLRTMVGPIGTG